MSENTNISENVGQPGQPQYQTPVPSPPGFEQVQASQYTGPVPSSPGPSVVPAEYDTRHVPSIPAVGYAQYKRPVPSPPTVGNAQYKRPVPSPPAVGNTQFKRPVPSPPIVGPFPYTMPTPEVEPVQHASSMPSSPAGQEQFARAVPSPPAVGQVQYAKAGPIPSVNQTQTSGGYAPIQYQAYGSPDPHQFYGMLIDASHHPSEVLCRLADALFFFIDQNSAVSRNTQLIDPAKYGWFMRFIGIDTLTVSVCEQILTPLYDGASVPYTIQSVNGARVPVLDRRGWLHLTVFETRAAPEDTHKHWTKMLNLLQLRDPATNTPFPSPIPRFAFPAIQDFALHQVYKSWQVQLVTNITRQRTQATIAGTLGLGTGGFGAGAAALGLGTGTAGQGASGQVPNAQTLQMMQKIEADKKKTSMINAGVSIFSTVMGGGPMGFGS